MSLREMTTLHTTRETGGGGSGPPQTRSPTISSSSERPGSGAWAEGAEGRRTEDRESFSEEDKGEENVPFLHPAADPPARRGIAHRIGIRISHLAALVARYGPGRQVLALATLFFICWFVIFAFMLPVMDKADRARLKVPESLEEVQEMYVLLGEYKQKNYAAILLGFSAVYLLKQALALPGSPLFNLLGGALFGVPVGFAVCLFCTSVGTALCYLFYATFGGPLVRRLFVEQLARLEEGVRHHRRRLFYYLAVIRIFPMTPNFFINLAAPLIRLPVIPHVAAATAGLAPITFLTCQAGGTLSTLQNLKDAVDKRILLTLAGLAVLASIPMFLKFDLPHQFLNGWPVLVLTQFSSLVLCLQAESGTVAGNFIGRDPRGCA